MYLVGLTHHMDCTLLFTTHGLTHIMVERPGSIQLANAAWPTAAGLLRIRLEGRRAAGLRTAT